MKLRLYLFMINYTQLAVLFILLIITRSYTFIIAFCEYDVIPIEQKQITDNPTYIEFTEKNLAILARVDLEKKQQILRILIRYTEQIQDAFDKHGLPLYMDQNPNEISISLYVANRDLLNKLIAEYSDSLFRQVIEHLCYNHANYAENVILNHLIAMYAAIIANPDNIDGNGYLINNNGILIDSVYQNILFELKKSKICNIYFYLKLIT